MHWDVFCRVVDNFGDIGVCWRLARQLVAEHGACVRLWVDDWTALRTLLPGCPVEPAQCVVDGVQILPWAWAEARFEPGQCVIEAFACHLPPACVAAMRAAARAPARAPVWVNLEYLSAEDWVEDCHALPSPDPASGLAKHFFFPGFTERTGGLLREAGLVARLRAQHAPAARTRWLARHAVDGMGGEACWISLFCYANPALPALLRAWEGGARPVLLWVPAGASLDAVSAALDAHALAPGGQYRRGALCVRALPFLPMDAYDTLLALCELNFVRGEDSFVRAQWAARPLVWQAYVQPDGVHLDKVAAFLARYRAGLSGAAETAQAALWRAWNTGGEAAAAWPAFSAALPSLGAHARRWCDGLAVQRDLAARLVEFVNKEVR